MNPLKRGTRRRPNLWRRLTGARRALPDAVIVGAQRSGTTFCYRHLLRHPQIAGAIWKEVHFFDRQENFARGVDWYRAHFAMRDRPSLSRWRNGKPRITIEATTSYMFRAWAPLRMAEHLPQARLIVLLRNPVERVLSNYSNAVLKGFDGGTLEEVVCAYIEGGDCDSSGASGRGRAMIERGHYAAQLEHLYRFYPRDRVHVEFSEDLFADAAASCGRILGFLGLEPFEAAGVLVKNRSKTREVPSPELRARLQAYYAPHNRRLVELLGRDPGWDQGETSG